MAEKKEKKTLKKWFYKTNIMVVSDFWSEHCNKVVSFFVWKEPSCRDPPLGNPNNTLTNNHPSILSLHSARTLTWSRSLSSWIPSCWTVVFFAEQFPAGKNRRGIVTYPSCSQPAREIHRLTALLPLNHCVWRDSHAQIPFCHDAPCRCASLLQRHNQSYIEYMSGTFGWTLQSQRFGGLESRFKTSFTHVQCCQPWNQSVLRSCLKWLLCFSGVVTRR